MNQIFLPSSETLATVREKERQRPRQTELGRERKERKEAAPEGKCETDVIHQLILWQLAQTDREMTTWTVGPCGSVQESVFIYIIYMYNIYRYIYFVYRKR